MLNILNSVYLNVKSFKIVIVLHSIAVFSVFLIKQMQPLCTFLYLCVYLYTACPKKKSTQTI